MSTKKARVLETNEQTYKKIGNRLKQLRKDAGFTAAEHFAYKNDISRAQYAKYEQGTDMKLSSLLKVLRAHKITIEQFFTGIKD